MELQYKNFVGHVTNQMLNTVAPERSKFFSKDEKFAAMAEKEKHKGSRITLITNYNDRDVETIYAEGREIEITSGKNAGEKIYRKGNFLRVEVAAGAQKHLVGYLVQYAVNFLAAPEDNARNKH